MAIHQHSADPRRLAPSARSVRAAAAEVFLADARAGLRKPRKELPCKYFYDTTGSALFDQICEQPEYYPTRTELAIMRAHAADMGRRLGAGCQVIEYGSGSSVKTVELLTHLPRPAEYVPVDVSGDHLLAAASRTRRRFPELCVTPVIADFTQPFDLPTPAGNIARRVVYFPGSTIGNFAPAPAAELLGSIADIVRPDGALLIGVDLKKDETTLTRAYNDEAGVTAAFNLNLLARLNHELGANFDLSQFSHRAHYNAELGRVEMHLVSRVDQTVQLGGESVSFAAGETIHTENSHKYTLAEFAALAAGAGLKPRAVWTDSAGLFSVQLFVC